MSDFERTFIGGPAVQTGFELEAKIGEGWEIDPDQPLTVGLFGNIECGLIRDPANAKDAPPKRSRAEILADARAAKAAKKLAEQNDNKEDPKE